MPAPMSQRECRCPCASTLGVHEHDCPIGKRNAQILNTLGEEAQDDHLFSDAMLAMDRATRIAAHSQESTSKYNVEYVSADRIDVWCANGCKGKESEQFTPGEALAFARELVVAARRGGAISPALEAALDAELGESHRRGGR